MRRTGTTISRLERRPDVADPSEAALVTLLRCRCAVARALGVAVVLTWACRWPARRRPRRQRRLPRRGPTASYEVAAQRQPLTTNASSAVAHDTETEALVAQSGRLFAATGQWEYPGPSAFGQVLIKKSKTSSVVGLRADAVSSGPGVGLLPDPERSGSRSGPLPPRDSGHRRRALEDPVVARRRQVVLPSQFVRSTDRCRCPCVRGARVGWGLVRLCRGPADGGHSRCLVACSPHSGVQSQARAQRGATRITWCGDTEGDGLRRLRRGRVHDHQHNALSAKRWHAALGYPSLGPGLPSATGRGTQQRAPGHHLRHP